MLTVTLHGRRLPLDGLTVDQLDVLTGKPSAHTIAALLTHAGIDPTTVKLADITINPDDDDLPTIYEDGLPTAGGRAMDAYVVVFGKPPWCWPPSVVRCQTVRDLSLILDSLEESS